MKVYNYSEARQNFSTVLNTALKEDVIIESDVTMKDILEAIKNGRER